MNGGDNNVVVQNINNLTGVAAASALKAKSSNQLI